MNSVSAHSAVRRAAALVLVATEGERGLALRLGHLAGQMDKRFNQRASIHHRHLPQPHLLVLGPVLSHVGINSPLVLFVQHVSQHDDSHLFLVSMTVNVLLEGLHSLEGLFAVNAVDEHEAIGKGIVVAGELNPIPETSGIIEAHLFPRATVSFYRANVDVLQRLHRLRTCNMIGIQ